MQRVIYGFLPQKGWAGVMEVWLMILLGVLLLGSLVFYFVYYRPLIRAPRPRFISLKWQAIKIVLLVGLILKVYYF